MPPGPRPLLPVPLLSGVLVSLPDGILCYMEEEEPARECISMSDEDGEMDFEAGMRGPGDEIMTYPGSFSSPGTCHLGVYH